ncbi:MAG: hypothetical protein D6798_19850 [Deltaproteobacteria bacterium]|nr:MAG: hypothetical protein D6798_19850 [Deltaproteobacteria bacterium]
MKGHAWILGLLGAMGLVGFVAAVATADVVQTPVAIGGVVSLALVIAWIALDAESLGRAARRRGTRYSVNATLLVVVVGAIAIAANVLAHRYDKRFDLSASQRFDLSEQTDKVLDGLDQDVRILAFFTSGSPEESDFRDLIEGYRARSEHIVVEFHDPVREPLLAEQNDITSSFGTVILRAGDSTQRLEFDFDEEAITNAIIRVTSGRQHPLCFVTGHGELDFEDSTGPTGLGMAVERLTGQNYTARGLSLVREGRVPDDCEVTVVADPQTDPLPAEREMLAAYVAGGGALVVLLDPMHAPELAADLARYGFRLQDDVVLEANPRYQLVGGDATWIVLDPDSFEPHAMTEDLAGMVILRLARSVGKGDSVSGITVQVLARTTPYGWAETTLDGATPPQPDDGDIVGDVPLVALAEVDDPAAISVGDMAIGAAGSTALPGLAAAPAPAAPPEVERKAGGRVLVFGDSDFASNELLGQGSNQDLFLNAIAWLVGEEDQVSIRPNEGATGSLTMNGLQGLMVWLLCLLVVPGVTVGMAIGTWRHRRNL